MIIAEALCLADKLTASDSAKLDAELLLAHALECSRTFLITWPERVLSKSQESFFCELIARRVGGEPIAYMLNQREFWSLSLEVSPSTLIPRPDTEVLVESALDVLNKPSLVQTEPSLNILDLGTGTGAIALALAKECPSAKVQGVDFNSEAVLLAERNRVQLKINNANFYSSDWFLEVEGLFDLIVSNPPYIDGKDPHLQQGDVRFEPLSALIAEDKGLADLRCIIQQAPIYLNDGGWLLLEHGCEQAKEVRELLENKKYCDVFTRRDYGDNDRVTGGRYVK